MILFSLLLFPIFFYDMTMNSLRYGLSFSICAVALDALYNKKNLLFILLSILAISIQYSSFLIVLVFTIFKLERKYLIGLIVLIAVAIPFLALNISYLYDKQDAYKDIYSPGAASGVGPLLLFSIIFITYYFDAGEGRPSKLLFLILALEMASFALAKITYAGLRLQMLFLFTLILLIKQEYFLIKKKREYLLILLLVGNFAFLLTARALSTVVEDQTTPSIPYKFFWQERN